MAKKTKKRTPTSIKDLMSQAYDIDLPVGRRTTKSNGSLLVYKGTKHKRSSLGFGIHSEIIDNAVQRQDLTDASYTYGFDRKLSTHWARVLDSQSTGDTNKYKYFPLRLIGIWYYLPDWQMRDQFCTFYKVGECEKRRELSKHPLFFDKLHAEIHRVLFKHTYTNTSHERWSKMAVLLDHAFNELWKRVPNDEGSSGTIYIVTP